MGRRLDQWNTPSGGAAPHPWVPACAGTTDWAVPRLRLGITMALRRPYKGDENGGGGVDGGLREQDEERRCKAIFMAIPHAG